MLITRTVHVQWQGEAFRAVRFTADDGIVTLCRSTDRGGATAYVGINRLAAHEQNAIYAALRPPTTLDLSIDTTPDQADLDSERW